MKTTNTPTIKEWSACGSDEDRWRFVIKYAPHIDMMLDNDCTMIKFGEDDDQWMHFDGYIGWNECAVGLGMAIGLRSCEAC